MQPFLHQAQESGYVIFPPHPVLNPLPEFAEALNTFVQNIRYKDLKNSAKQKQAEVNSAILKHLGDRVKRVELYGSTRSGIVTPSSDIDLVVMTHKTYQDVSRSSEECKLQRWRAKQIDKMQYELMKQQIKMNYLQKTGTLRSSRHSEDLADKKDFTISKENPDYQHFLIDLNSCLNNWKENWKKLGLDIDISINSINRIK